MAHFVPKIIWVAIGKVDDPHDLVRRKNRRGTRAFFIGQDWYGSGIILKHHETKDMKNNNLFFDKYIYDLQAWIE